VAACARSARGLLKARIDALFPTPIMGRLPEAAAMLERALEFGRKAIGDESDDVLVGLSNLASIYSSLGRLNDAVSRHEKVAVVIESRLGKEHWITLKASNNRAYTYQHLGRITDAVALYEETLNIQRRVLGDKKNQTLVTMHNLGELYYDSGRRDEGIALLDEAEEKVRRFLGPEHPATLNVMSCLSAIRMSENDVDRRQEAMAEHVLRVRRRLFGDENKDTLGAMHALGNIYWKLDRHKEALELLEEELEGCRKKEEVAKDGPLLDRLRYVAKLYRYLDQVDDAERLELEMEAREAVKTERAVVVKELPAPPYSPC
jgi:tetratricopeptide (TPR) repeat protein